MCLCLKQPLATSYTQQVTWDFIYKPIKIDKLLSYFDHLYIYNVA